MLKQVLAFPPGCGRGLCFAWCVTATAHVCADDIAVRAVGIWGQIEGRAAAVTPMTLDTDGTDEILVGGEDL